MSNETPKTVEVDLVFLEKCIGKCVDNNINFDCESMYNEISKMAKVVVNKGTLVFYPRNPVKYKCHALQAMILEYFNCVKRTNPNLFDVKHGTEFFSTEQCIELINIDVMWFQKFTVYQSSLYRVCSALIEKDYSQFYFIDSVNAKKLMKNGLLEKNDYENICRWEQEDDFKLFGGLRNTLDHLDFDFYTTNNNEKILDKAKSDSFQKRRVMHFENEVKKRQRVDK